MSAFVVITEDWYGGDHKIKVFRKRSDAENYANTLPNDTDRIVFETPFPKDTNTSFVLVTEEWYGGGSNKIKLFRTNEEAKRYGESVNENGRLEAIVLERTVG